MNSFIRNNGLVSLRPPGVSKILDFLETSFAPVATKVSEQTAKVNDSDAGQAEFQSLLQGDSQAFALIVDEHQQMILALAQSMGFKGLDRDEAVADVFAQIYLALPKFKGRSNLSTWIYRIALRTLAKLRLRRHRHSQSVPSDQTPDFRQTLPDQRLQTTELQTKLWDAVAALDARSAAAVELFYRQNWPLEKIAGVLECSVGAAKTILFRAREQLRQKLKPEQFE
jgi:RNA polymerase sigma factor (sigma-70 family)